MARKKITPMETESALAKAEAAPPAIRKPRKPKTVGETGTVRRTSTRRKAAAGSNIHAETPVDAFAAKPANFSDEILESEVSDHEQIALLAYSFWEARGYQGGSPEADWYRAEQELRRQRQAGFKEQ